MDPNASMESGDQEFQVGGRFLTFFSIFDSSFYASLNLMIQYILQTPYNTLAGVELLQKCQRKWEEEPPDLSLTLIVKASKIKVAYTCAIFICLTRFLSLFLCFFFLRSKWVSAWVDHTVADPWCQLPQILQAEKRNLNSWRTHTFMGWFK